MNHHDKLSEAPFQWLLHVAPNFKMQKKHSPRSLHGWWKSVPGCGGTTAGLHHTKSWSSADLWLFNTFRDGLIACGNWWSLDVVGTVPSLECLSTHDGCAANLALLTFNVSESDRQKLPAAQTSSLALVAALSHSFADNSTPCEHDSFQTTQIQVCPWFIITMKYMKSKLPCFMGYPHISSYILHVHSHISLCFYTVSLHSTGHNWNPLESATTGSHVDQHSAALRHGGRLETQDLDDGDDGWPGGQVAMAQRWGSLGNRWSRWGMDALFSSFMSEVSNIKTAKMKKLWTE